MCKKIVLPSLLIFSFLALAGCNEVKTERWYKDNPEAMNKAWSECKKSGDDTPNCRNAISAHYQMQKLNASVPDLNDISKPENPKKG